MGAESEPQCSVHCCIMTLFMSWAENSVGKQCNSFMRTALPLGRGWAGFLRRTPPGTGSSGAPGSTITAVTEGHPGFDSQGPGWFGHLGRGLPRALPC